MMEALLLFGIFCTVDSLILVFYTLLGKECADGAICKIPP